MALQAAEPSRATLQVGLQPQRQQAVALLACMCSFTEVALQLRPLALHIPIGLDYNVIQQVESTQCNILQSMQGIRANITAGS